MSTIYRLLRGALFRLDAERAHHLAIDAAALAEWMLEHGAGSLLHAPPAGEPVQLLGKTFANRIGLAAGFDKNGVAPHLMVTDPPYGVKYDASWRDEAAGKSGATGTAKGKVLNDDNAD